MIQCVFNSITLPLNFAYQRRYKKRLSIEETLTADVTQQDTYYAYDELFDFTLKYGTSSLRDTFLTAFENSTSSFVFTDYDSISYAVILIEVNVEEVGGYYNLSGIMKRTESLS